MYFLGRKVIPTTLDPVPRNMRAVPGCLVLNGREIQALEDSDGAVFKKLSEIAIAETRGDALRTWRRKR
jgi:hypothetical protein